MALEKALIINTLTGIPIPVMFNPNEYTLERTNDYAEIPVPGLGAPLLQFVRGIGQTLTMDLFFDTSEDNRDVRIYTDILFNLLEINPIKHKPPALLFIWGSLVFPCTIQSVRKRFTMFSSSGSPLRATLSVTFKSYNILEELLKKIPLQSADRSKSRIAKQGDTLSSVAADEYDDPQLWRPIAKANNIDNPRYLPPGQLLTIPPLTTGERT